MRREAGERTRRVAAENHFGQIEDAAAIGEPQHGAHGFGGDVAFAHGDRLIENGKPVAHGPFRGARNEGEGIGVGLGTFVGDDFAEVFGQHRLLDAAKIETLAARQHRHRNLADFRRRENEFDVRGRLLERLQKGVEGALGEHVDFVDDEHLGAGEQRRVLRALDDLADVVDAGVRRRVHFEHVRVAAFHDLGAVRAEAGHIDGRTVDTGCFVVDGAGEDAGRRGLADAAHAGQHVALRDAPRGEGVLQAS